MQSEPESALEGFWVITHSIWRNKHNSKLFSSEIFAKQTVVLFFLFFTKC